MSQISSQEPRPYRRQLVPYRRIVLHIPTPVRCFRQDTRTGARGLTKTSFAGQTGSRTGYSAPRQRMIAASSPSHSLSLASSAMWKGSWMILWSRSGKGLYTPISVRITGRYLLMKCWYCGTGFMSHTGTGSKLGFLPRHSWLTVTLSRPICRM